MNVRGIDTRSWARRWAALLVLLPALGAGTALAQVSVDMEIEPGVLAVGEQGELTVAVRGARRPVPPPLPADVGGLQIRFSGSEQRVSIVNGRRDEALVYRYSVIALKEGEFRVGPIAYELDGQRLELPEITVPVVPGAAARGGVRSLSDALFAELRAERTHPFVGESFDLVLSIYFRTVNLDRDLNLTGLPESGLQFQRWEELPAGREARNDRLYEVRRFRTRVRALAAGTYRLTPQLRVQLLIERRERRRQPFDDFFPGFPDLPGFGRVERQPVDLPVSPLEIAVRPLPAEGRPASFTGGVGRFNFDVTVEPTELAVGDPLTVRLTIEGEGNADALPAPPLNIGSNFRAYEPQLATRDSAPTGRRARRVFEQVLIPRDETATEVPAVEFSYFDPRAESYRTIVRGPFPLKLTAATNGVGRIVAPPAPGAEPSVRVEGADLVYLKTDVPRWRRTNPTPGYARRFWRGYPWLMPLLPAIAFLFDVRRRARAGDPARVRRERAPRAARAGLRRAEAAARAGDRVAFHDAVWASLAAYFGDRLNLPPGEVAAETVIARAGEAAPDAWRDEVRRLFAECMAARYAGAGAPAPDYPAMLARLRAVLRQSERLKW